MPVLGYPHAGHILMCLTSALVSLAIGAPFYIAEVPRTSVPKPEFISLAGDFVRKRLPQRSGIERAVRTSKGADGDPVAYLPVVTGRIP